MLQKWMFTHETGLPFPFLQEVQESVPPAVNILLADEHYSLCLSMGVTYTPKGRKNVIILKKIPKKYCCLVLCPRE